jgi:hypothetical protein
MFKSHLTIIYVTSPALKSTAYTIVLAIRQPKSYIESLNTLDMTMSIKGQLTT